MCSLHETILWVNDFDISYELYLMSKKNFVFLFRNIFVIHFSIMKKIVIKVIFTANRYVSSPGSVGQTPPYDCPYHIVATIAGIGNRLTFAIAVGHLECSAICRTTRKSAMNCLLITIEAIISPCYYIKC